MNIMLLSFTIIMQTVTTVKWISQSGRVEWVQNSPLRNHLHNWERNPNHNLKSNSTIYITYYSKKKK